MFRFILLVLFLGLNSNIVFSKNIKPLELLSNVDMFDVGLAKIDEDQNYDIYTVNHVFAESILLSKNGEFLESGNSLGLSQTNGLPKYEPTGNSPVLQQGLNIFSVKRKQLILFCNECEKQTKGKIIFPTPKNNQTSVNIIHKEKAIFTQNYLVTQDQKHQIEIDFEINPIGVLVFDVLFFDVPIEFDIDLQSESIYLGSTSTSPESNKFILSSMDNHSFAWAKINNDKYSDVYIPTGGLRALINAFHPTQILDEFFYVFTAMV